MTQMQTFLSTQGAIFEGDALIHFGNPNIERQATDKDIITALSHMGILEVRGEDAITFLQGQLTNDIKQLNGTNSQYSGYCNPKGRLLGLFLAFAHQDHLHLQLPSCLIEGISKRLRMYVMRSKVTIEDKSDQIISIGIAGPNAESKLKALFGAAPKAAQELITLEDATLLRLPGDFPRYQVFTHQVNLERIWQALSSDTQKVGQGVWDYLEIQAGIPEITTATQEAFVPQMLNLDALDGINFKKGCYTGQEIVARTHYLGKVKRRTQMAHIDIEVQPKAGDIVTLKNTEEAIGQIVRSAEAPNGGFDVLVEMRLENFESDKDSISCNGSLLAFKTLPYPLN
jgi:folate-binding protein YgfZ